MVKGLTKEQQTLEKEFGVVHKLNKEGKMYLETNYKYNTFLINKGFQNTIKIITSGYSQAEIDTWNTKVSEAKIVIGGGTSSLLSSLLLKGEILIDFANNILLKANEYSKIYCEAEKIKRERLNNLKIK